jgi:hypothetical protein
MEPRSTDEQSATLRLDLSANELELVRTALMILEDTLGRDEAEELAEVQALLARLPATR